MGMPGLLAALVLAQAVDADEATRALRIAWASQYEWREDDVANATIPFRARVVERRGDRGETVRTHEGALVVVGPRLVRIHAPGLDAAEREELAEHLRWVVGRFARAPFEEEFADAEIGPGEELEGGVLRVPAGDRAYRIAKDRLEAVETPWTVGDRTQAVPVSYRTAKLRDGYVVEAEEFQPTGPEGAFRWSRALHLRKAEGPPQPGEYVHLLVAGDTRTSTRIEFDPTRFDVEHPVVLDPAARATLAAAWGSRYVLPDDIRIQGEFQRKIDASLDRLGWVGTVKGTLQVWGLGRIAVELDEKAFRNPAWRDSVAETCAGHFRRFFALVDGRPFDEAFADCGFVHDRTLDGAQAIRVVGHPFWEGFLVEDGRVTGHLDGGADPADDDAWWTWRLRRAGSDGALVSRMTRRVERERVDLELSWARARGVYVPREFEVFVPPTRNDPVRNTPIWGVVRYELKRPRVDVPRDG